MSQQFREVTTWLREQVVGGHTRIQTPFGPRLIYYADLTATGRHLAFVDEWVNRLSPYYANTHTAVSSTGNLLTELRATARAIIAQAVNASNQDEVVFVGSGATAAANKLVGLLGWRISEPLERVHRLGQAIPAAARPVVFVGPYEHHSNLLPWLESIAEVVEIGADSSGKISLGELEARLAQYSARETKVGSFSAASNVTGVLSDVRAIARVLHRNGALAFFDYAAAAPYVPIDMHPGTDDERVDALFLSPHKFLGGPGSSGVLVARRELFRSRVPERPGGGTVDYVAGARRDAVDYVTGLAEREEGGTPAIAGDLRAGASFLVKHAIGPQEILEHEMRLAEAAIARLAQHRKIKVLGPRDLPRLAILSLSIDGLHHDLASALLDHLFGIQNRAGCSCAGPYGHDLLGIRPEASARFRRLVRRGLNGMKPGWVRLSLPYYANPEDIEFVLRAIEFVADHGIDFVPLYRLNWRDGVWRHIDGVVPPSPGIELSIEALEDAADNPRGGVYERRLGETALREERQRYFDEARDLAVRLGARFKVTRPRWNLPTGDAEIDELVWFRYVHAEGLSDVP
ncbi:MAG TPA: aminotransferase class V-fold PLP-dependent enzyme [Candidatus Polarisedimenticolaceae bacterium]|nr:aminotransferase class V-fold PLP-dependent enzyme [Candidatus Polarisedimenticolaceae bacterium]